MLALQPALLCADEDAPEARVDAPVSIWDGVYTEAQARRGEYLYPGPCGKCHGVRLDGAPEDPDMFSTRPIAGPKFLRDWEGRSLGALFDYLKATMPENNPGFLADEEYAELIAYMLFKSGTPAGAAELRPDRQALWALRISARR